MALKPKKQKNLVHALANRVDHFSINPIKTLEFV